MYCLLQHSAMPSSGSPASIKQLSYSCTQNVKFQATPTVKHRQTDVESINEHIYLGTQMQSKSSSATRNMHGTFSSHIQRTKTDPEFQ